MRSYLSCWVERSSLRLLDWEPKMMRLELRTGRQGSSISISFINQKTTSPVRQQNQAIEYNLLRMKVLTTTILQDLKHSIDPDTLSAFSIRYSDELHSQNNCKSQQAVTCNTIATNRTQGSAISRDRGRIRPESKSRSRDKMKQTLRTTQVSLGRWLPEKKPDVAETVESPIENTRKIITDRAVYYGNVQLPYLHSSDAIASLYEKKKEDRVILEPLINPTRSIPAHTLSGLKSLYLYYTSIDSLRQLGTGWSNLKSLTIMCSRELRDLSGLCIFPSLEHLYVPFNRIVQISDLMYHSSLRCVDLHGNELTSMEQMQYLYTICNLEWVDVSNNPITEEREKFRILRENLSTKMEVEHDDRLLKYCLNQMDLDQLLSAYEGIQNSNSLIRQINDQIRQDQIPVGSVWKNVGDAMCSQTEDIQIMGDAVLSSDDEDEESFLEEGEAQQLDARKQEQIQLRVTPLISYLEGDMNLEPLKKYFHNKVCPQSKPEQGKKKSPPKESIINEDKLSKKLANTHGFSRNISEEKNSAFSASTKKKLARFSLAKNSLRTNSAQLQELDDTRSSGLKFNMKRHLFRSSEKPFAQVK